MNSHKTFSCGGLEVSTCFISCMTRWAEIWLGAKEISVVIQLQEEFLLIMLKNKEIKFAG